MKSLPLVLLFSICAAAQVTPPLLGWLPDGPRILRMNGLPAAATIGAPADVGLELARIAVSPRQDYVLASALVTGDVVLIVPGNPPVRLNAAAYPDQIVMSPTGSSAALWYSASARFEIISGLPAAPAIHELGAASLYQPVAIAVSDDGQWIATASSSGAVAWNANGASNQFYGAGDASALAFFAGRSDLAVATATQLLSLADIGGAAFITTLYQGTFSPAGLAISFDNQKVVLADATGAIYSVDLATNTPSTFDCQCRPAGVFGLGGGVFRLTNSTLDPVKLFDASAGAILAVPRATTLKSPHSAVLAATAPALPTLNITLLPAPSGYLLQPALTITASSPYSSEIDGTVTLAFTSSVGGGDQTIQFSTGGSTVNFTIPANSTQANFSGNPSVTFSTGTVAGTTTLNVNVPSASASPVATRSFTTNPGVPFISTVQFSQTTGALSVVVTGFSSTRDMVSGSFQFAPSSNATLAQPTVTVQLASAFTTWYQNPDSNASGSEFTLTVPFSVQGDGLDIVAVTVTLTNSKGTSNPVSPSQ